MSRSLMSTYTYANNASIKIDGTSLEKYIGMDDKPYMYVTQMVRILDQIWNRPPGRKILEAVGKGVAFDRTVKIQPFEPYTTTFSQLPEISFDFARWYSARPVKLKRWNFENAYNKPPMLVGSECVIGFSPETFTDPSKPGAAVDELLLHEFLHMFDNFQGGYRDARDGTFKFDSGDFLTVTATNVYAASANESGRPLRRDHHGFDPMPPRFAKSPRDYATFFWKNFAHFRKTNPRLHRVLSEQESSWNPFAWDSATEVFQYRVVVKSKSWSWNFVLFKDDYLKDREILTGGRAYWEDVHAMHQFGFGSWEDRGSHRYVKWDTDGSWDIIPLADRVGTTSTGGAQYQTDVSRIY